MKDFSESHLPCSHEYVQKNMIIFLAAISEERSYLSKLDVYLEGMNSIIFPRKDKDTKASTRCGGNLQRGLLSVKRHPRTRQDLRLRYSLTFFAFITSSSLRSKSWEAGMQAFKIGLKNKQLGH